MKHLHPAVVRSSRHERLFPLKRAEWIDMGQLKTYHCGETSVNNNSKTATDVYSSNQRAKQNRCFLADLSNTCILQEKKMCDQNREGQEAFRVVGA